VSAADQVLDLERHVTNATACSAGNVAFWACVAARSHMHPAMHGQAIGYAHAFALALVDRGADPRDVRHLLSAAALRANDYSNSTND
jgi:hypothetical protein